MNVKGLNNGLAVQQWFVNCLINYLIINNICILYIIWLLFWSSTISIPKAIMLFTDAYCMCVSKWLLNIPAWLKEYVTHTCYLVCGTNQTNIFCCMKRWSIIQE